MLSLHWSRRNCAPLTTCQPPLSPWSRSLFPCSRSHSLQAPPPEPPAQLMTRSRAGRETRAKCPLCVHLKWQKWIKEIKKIKNQFSAVIKKTKLRASNISFDLNLPTTKVCLRQTKIDWISCITKLLQLSHPIVKPKHCAMLHIYISKCTLSTNIRTVKLLVLTIQLLVQRHSERQLWGCPQAHQQLMVQQRWQQVWGFSSEDAAGLAIRLAALTTAFQPTRCTSQPLDWSRPTSQNSVFHFSTTGKKTNKQKKTILHIYTVENLKMQQKPRFMIYALEDE